MFGKKTLSHRIILIKCLHFIPPFCTMKFGSSSWMPNFMYKMTEWQTIEGKHLIKIILRESVSLQKVGHI